MAEITESGFEYGGKFYRWHVSDMGKDLMLIDRFSGMPINEFFETLDDDHERMRAPVLLSLIACSIRHGEPEWSVERIVRGVMSLELSAITFIDSDSDEDEGPLAAPAMPSPTSLDAPSPSTANGSSPSSIPPVSSPSETSSETPV